jgi:HAT1-interacting factor 1
VSGENFGFDGGELVDENGEEEHIDEEENVEDTELPEQGQEDQDEDPQTEGVTEEGGAEEDDQPDDAGNSFKLNLPMQGQEEEDDFATAWEVLDLARVLFLRDEDDGSKRQVGDVYIWLGDVSLETENFAQATADYTEGLRLKQLYLEPNHREIAEAEYKLCLALEYDNKQDDAKLHLQQAMDVLERRKADLSTRVGAEPVSKKGKEKIELSDERLELNEIDELLKDLKEKVFLLMYHTRRLGLNFDS